MSAVRNSLGVLAALAGCAIPLLVAAKPVGTFDWIIVGPGDQTAPSIDGQYVVYASRPDPSASWDVLLHDLVSGSATPLAATGEDEDSPDVARSVVAWRSPAGITVSFFATDMILRGPAEPGAGAPAVSPFVAAWEQGPPGDRDIGYFLFGGGPVHGGVLGGTGDQLRPAAAGTVVAYVDESALGAVMLHDAAKAETWLLVEGRATGVGLSGTATALRAAVARGAAGGDPDIEVYDGAGVQLARMDVPGEQRNPHVSGDWVAFEDLSTGRSQVVLWNYAAGIVYVPQPSESDQILNDLSAGPDLVRVVFADDLAGNLDIALYVLPLPVVDDGTGSNWPPGPPPPPAGARCDDPEALVLAELLLVREKGKPRAGAVAFEVEPGGGDDDRCGCDRRRDRDCDRDDDHDRDQDRDRDGDRDQHRDRDRNHQWDRDDSSPVRPERSAAAGGAKSKGRDHDRDHDRDRDHDWGHDRCDPADAEDFPVLVCIDAERVSSAWVTLDGEVVAAPRDFEPKVAHLEVRTELEGTKGCLAAVMEGKPGSSLRIRVLADPGRAADDGAAPGTTAEAHGDDDAISADAPSARPGAGGCSAAGADAAGLLAFGLLALAAGHRRRAARIALASTRGR